MEYSSGCESGWTMYLGEQSPQELTSVSERNGEHGKSGWYPEGEGTIEDLSMVSDASSGPPMFHEEEEEDENCSKESVTQKYGQWKKMKKKGRERHDSLLDDTASSHAFGLFKTGNHGIANQKASSDVVEFSMGFSFTDYKGKSASQKQYTYLQVPPPDNATPAKPVYKESRRNKK